MVEPVHPFEGGEFHGLERPPWGAPVNDLGLVEAVDALGQGVVVAVADGRRLAARCRFGRGARCSGWRRTGCPVAVMHETAAIQRAPLVQRLFQRIWHEARLRRSRYAPTDDPVGIGVARIKPDMRLGWLTAVP